MSAQNKFQVKNASYEAVRASQSLPLRHKSKISTLTVKREITLSVRLLVPSYICRLNLAFTQPVIRQLQLAKVSGRSSTQKVFMVVISLHSRLFALFTVKNKITVANATEQWFRLYFTQLTPIVEALSTESMPIQGV